MERGAKIGLIAAVLVGIASFMLLDVQISQFAESIRAIVPSWFFIGFTFEIQTFLILFFLTSLFLFREHKRKWVVPLWVTAICAIMISYLLKILIIRPRPFEAGIVSVLSIAVHLMGGVGAWNSSFPSFQAVLAFSALPILSKEFKRFKWVWFAIACIIAFSRVYFGLHYASDVLFGGAIGYLIGWFVVKLEEENSFGERIYRGIKRIIKRIKGY